MKVQETNPNQNQNQNPIRKRSTREIYWLHKEKKSPLSNSVILWAHNIRSLHNVGAIFRNCDAFGVAELWLSGFTPRPPRPEISKAAIGAEETVKWRSIDRIDEGIAELRLGNVELIALEQTDQSTEIGQYQPETNPVCIVLGNEVTGVDDILLQHCHRALEIPQFGTKHSLNVSVASGIALYALLMARQKTQSS